jgi:transporter family-2 protein
MYIVYALLVLAAGALSPAKAGMDGKMNEVFGAPFAAATFSVLLSLVCVLVVMLGTGQVQLPTKEEALATPWYFWLGGVAGAAIAVIALVAAPKLGAATYVVLFVAGQLALSVTLDHFGWLGFEQQAVNWQRLAGVALVAGGVWLITRS